MGHAHHFLSRLDRVSVPHIELTFSLLRHHRDHYKAHPALPRSQRAPTRNGARPCGSGKKYKRCCGEAP